MAGRAGSLMCVHKCIYTTGISMALMNRVGYIFCASYAGGWVGFRCSFMHTCTVLGPGSLGLD
jgi:hypothetical protein